MACLEPQRVLIQSDLPERLPNPGIEVHVDGQHRPTNVQQLSNRSAKKTAEGVEGPTVAGIMA